MPKDPWQASESENRKPKRTRVFWPLMLAFIVAASSVGGVVYVGLLHKSPAGVPPKFDDGPTFHQALRAVNATVQRTSGGPWVLFSAIGLAAQAGYAPMAIGEFNNNLTLKYCSAQFDGLTIWNGTSFPTFDGNIASGTAPFWQFAFASSSTSEITVATDVSGLPKVYPPISNSTECAIYSGMARAPSIYESWVNPLPIDTPLQAANASVDIGAAYARANSPIVEMFNFGWIPFSDATNHGGNGVGLVVTFSRCGIVGAAGFQPKVIVGELSSGQVANTFIGALSCTAVGNATSNPIQYVPYDIQFPTGGFPIGVGSGTAGLDLAFQVEFPGTASNSTPDFDAWGLVSWMTNISLLTSGGNPLPSASPTCMTWVPGLTGCAANPSGWSAILVTANGDWMDEFPAPGSAHQWGISNALLVSGERLVLLTPSSWSLIGDTMNVGGTQLIPYVSGTVPV